MIEMIKSGDPTYLRMKKMARDNAVKNYDWNRVVESIAGEDCLAA